jgi:hypothetical protein
MMEDAMSIVQQELDTDNERFQLEKQELQRLAKTQRKAAEQNRGVREVPDEQYVLRYFIKCFILLCSGTFFSILLPFVALFHIY